MGFSGINHVALVVSDMERSVRFYQNVLGLHEVDDMPDRAFVALSWGENLHDLALVRGSGDVAPGGGGMHHVAFPLAGGLDALGVFATMLRERGVVIESCYDHFVTQSVYFADPDGNRLEVYVDAPRETWEHVPHAMFKGGPLQL